MIKNERNKCVNLIQTSTQKAAEMKEKIKILQNEIEILRTEVSKKDKSVLNTCVIFMFYVCCMCVVSINLYFLIQFSVFIGQNGQGSNLLK